VLRAEGRSLIRLPDEGRTEHILRTSREKIRETAAAMIRGADGNVHQEPWCT
jgi:ElaB/YqjD/DUF883 family membrane-anchored ribosome-binding protein